MSLLGLCLPAVVYALVFVLQAWLPARRVVGYAADRATGEPLHYRLNGLWVFLIVVGGFAAGAAGGLWAWDLFYRMRWEGALSACLLGLGFTALVVLSAPAGSGSILKALYLGRRDNPQWRGGRVDAKMYLYLIGAVMLELNVLSFAAHHVTLYPTDPSPGVFLYAALFTFFLAEYLFFERVHLFTYDFIAEKVGFKLGWGCFVFYPYFYGVGLWALADAPNPNASWHSLVLAALVFLSGWALSRGANLQKYWFKRDPSRAVFGLLRPSAIEGGGHRLLVSGFWGLSRHVNYFGEVLMAVGLTLALGRLDSPWPWLYPLYYVALLVPRQLDDDRRCAAKYGPLWDAYCQRVRYRIIPGVY